MRRQQRLHEGERSDVVLQVLDDVKRGLTYDGWEFDVQIAELRWAKGENMAASIQITVEKMRRKQRLHEGERSDVVLQVLDDVKRGLTYDGWEADVQIVERRWAKGENMAASIQSTVEKMRRQQRLHEGERSDVVLQVLDD